MRKILILILLCCSGLGLWAEPLSDRAFISVLTCSPGEELYARYGHTALRVCDPEQNIDLTFNYGQFDFNTESFYWKFVRGETWYQLGMCSTSDFLYEYAYFHRTVYEQVLNLSPEQVNRVAVALAENYQPQNRQYLYNFVFDNCATRPFYLLQEALGSSLRSTYQGAEGQTYRHFIHHYTRAGSWADLGINLIFGHRAQHKMRGQERLFLPEELMFYLSEAKLSDGTPLVREQHIEHFSIQSVPWYRTWYFGLGCMALIVLLITLRDRKRQRPGKWVDIVFVTLYGLLLCITVFLTFFSIHPLVGFGFRLLLVLIVYICIRLIYIIR